MLPSLHAEALKQRVPAVGDEEKYEPEDEKNPHAVALGGSAGRRGREKLTADEQHEIARRTAEKRWQKR